MGDSYGVIPAGFVRAIVMEHIFDCQFRVKKAVLVPFATLKKGQESNEKYQLLKSSDSSKKRLHACANLLR